MLCRIVLGPDRATVVYGWVFAAHQIGGSIAAIGAAVARVKFGDYAAAFYVSGLISDILDMQVNDSRKTRNEKVEKKIDK